MAEPNPFLPEVTTFALTLHATPPELVAIAQGWAHQHSLSVAVERFFPTSAAVSLPLAADVAAAVARQQPVRRLCLRREPFFDGAINECQQTQCNPECLTIVLARRLRGRPARDRADRALGRIDLLQEHDLAAAGVPLLAASASAVCAFYDLG